MLGMMLLFIGVSVIAGNLTPESASDDEANHDSEERNAEYQISKKDSIFDDEWPSPGESHEIGGGVDEQLDIDTDYIERVDSEVNSVSNGDFTIDLSGEEIEHYPSPLCDWVFEGEIDIIKAGESDTVSVSAPEGAKGSLGVLHANYSEHDESDQGSTFRVYSGLNVYFIPEGESFPDDYKWSEEGGALYKMAGSHEDEADFGGIKLISRIDTGSFGGRFSDADDFESIFDERLGLPNIESTLQIRFI